MAESDARVAVLFLAGAAFCFAVAYLTAIGPSSIGATELIEIMIGFGILFSALFTWVMYSAIKS